MVAYRERVYLFLHGQNKSLVFFDRSTESLEYLSQALLSQEHLLRLLPTKALIHMVAEYLCTGVATQHDVLVEARTMMAPTSLKRRHAFATVVKDTIWLIGGSDSGGLEGSKVALTTTTIDIYDPLMNGHIVVRLSQFHPPRPLHQSGTMPGTISFVFVIGLNKRRTITIINCPFSRWWLSERTAAAIHQLCLIPSAHAASPTLRLLSLPFPKTTMRKEWPLLRENEVSSKLGGFVWIRLSQQ